MAAITGKSTAQGLAQLTTNLRGVSTVVCLLTAAADAGMTPGQLTKPSWSGYADQTIVSGGWTAPALDGVATPQSSGGTPTSSNVNAVSFPAYPAGAGANITVTGIAILNAGSTQILYFENFDATAQYVVAPGSAPYTFAAGAIKVQEA